MGVYQDLILGSLNSEPSFLTTALYHCSVSCTSARHGVCDILEPQYTCRIALTCVCALRSPQAFLIPLRQVRKGSERLLHSPTSVEAACKPSGMECQEKQYYHLLYGSVLIFNSHSYCQITRCTGSGTISFIVSFPKPIDLREWHAFSHKLNRIEKACFLTLSFF